MEPILKSFSISFLLRSVFAGAYFVISYYVASHNPREFAQIVGATILSVALPVALFAGVTAYGIHRSLLYPFIESWFDSGQGHALRRWMPLIRGATIDMLLRRWDRGAEKDECDCERARHVAIWADYTHLQYASTLCIALGALLGKTIVPGKHPPYWPLVILATLLLLAAFVSDWRLHSIHDHINNEGHRDQGIR